MRRPVLTFILATASAAAACFAPSESDYVGGDAAPFDAQITLGDDGAVLPSDAGDGGPACTGPHTYFNRKNGSCYEARPSASFGGAARGDCESRGQHLVSITDQDEQDFVANQVAAIEFVPDSGPPNFFWIGLVNQTLDGGAADFRWSDGEPVAYTNWDGVPGKNPCVVEYVGKLAPHWDDFQCDLLVGHICER